MDVIAERARNPVVARRARAFMRVREQRAADARAKAEAGARRRTLLTEGVDALEHASDPTRARAELDRLEAEFGAPAGDAGSAEDAARFAARVAAQRARLDALEQAEAAAAAERAARAAGIDGARSADRPRRRGRRRPRRASRRAARRVERAAVARRRRRRQLDPPLRRHRRADARPRRGACPRRGRPRRRRGPGRRIEALVAPDASLDESERAWPALESEWKTLTAPLALDAELSDRVARVAETFADRRRARHADAAKVREDRLETWKALAATAAAVAGPARRAAPRRRAAVRDLKAVLEPQAAAARRTTRPGARRPRRSPPSCARRWPRSPTRVRELRDAEEWRRWANAGIQEALVTQVEALKASKDLPNVARQLRDLRRQWKAVSAGRATSRRALWQRFKSAADELQARCDEQARLVAAEQAVHLAARVALCESAEALAESTEWVATAETLKQLQTAVGRGRTGAARTRSPSWRAASAPPATRSSPAARPTSSAQAGWAENAAKKEALCVQAEALAESTDWQVALTGIKQLQAEWKAVGPVRRNRAELLWKRFRAACDRFFERYGQRHQIAEQQRARTARGRRPAARGAGRRRRRRHAAGRRRRHRPGSVDEWQSGAGLSGETGSALRARFDAALHADRRRGGRGASPARASTSAPRSRAARRCARKSRPRSPARPSRPRLASRRRRRWLRCCKRVAGRQHDRRPRQRGRQAAGRRPTRCGARSSSGVTWARPSARPRPRSRRGSTRRAALLRSPSRAAARAAGWSAAGRAAARRRWRASRRPRGDRRGRAARRRMARHGRARARRRPDRRSLRAIRARSAASPGNFQLARLQRQRPTLQPADVGLGVGRRRWAFVQLGLRRTDA